MPDFDAGTYFLTVLIPVKKGNARPKADAAKNAFDKRMEAAVRKIGEDAAVDIGYRPDQSWAQRLKFILATLPTALQTPATQRIGMNSPFARNTRNHLARLVVIDDVIYNGRTPNTLPFSDTLKPQKVDKLKSAYLLFTAEVDAVEEDGQPLPSKLSKEQQDRVRDSYLETLWETAKEQLQPVFENCDGFDDSIDSPAAFARYITRYQQETTMPFHDYWIEPPAIPELPLNTILTSLKLLAAVFILAIVGWLVHAIVDTGLPDSLFPWTMAGAVVLAVCIILLAYWRAMALGESPFPAPVHGNLPSVLKAIYLQQQFSRFVSDNQLSDAEELHKNFGVFAEDHKPDNWKGPTQKPGYVSITSEGAISSGLES